MDELRSLHPVTVWVFFARDGACRELITARQDLRLTLEHLVLLVTVRDLLDTWHNLLVALAFLKVAEICLKLVTCSTLVLLLFVVLFPESLHEVL